MIDLIYMGLAGICLCLFTNIKVTIENSAALSEHRELDHFYFVEEMVLNPPLHYLNLIGLFPLLNLQL